MSRASFSKLDGALQGVILYKVVLKIEVPCGEIQINIECVICEKTSRETSWFIMIIISIIKSNYVFTTR